MSEIKTIAIVGASGSTGKEVTRIALEKGYKIIIVARNPDKFSPQENVQIVKGDVTENLANALKDADAVISCFGPQNGRKPGKIMSEGVHNILRACDENRISRFVFMSGILQSSGKELSALDGFLVKTIRQFYKEGFEDKTIAEKEILASKINTVIVRAVGLGNSAPTGTYNAGENARVKPFKTLPYSDCALCLVDAVSNENWTNKIINVGRKN